MWPFRNRAKKAAAVAAAVAAGEAEEEAEAEGVWRELVVIPGFRDMDLEEREMALATCGLTGGLQMGVCLRLLQKLYSEAAATAG